MVSSVTEREWQREEENVRRCESKMREILEREKERP